MSYLSRRTLLGAAASVPAAGLLTACSGEDEPAAAGGPADAVTYVTNFGQLGRDAYAYVALNKGFFTEANLDVTIEPGTGTNPNLQALLGGQAQFTTVDMAGAIIARNEQEGFVALAAIQQLPLAAIMTFGDSGITVPQELAGSSVGFPVGAVTELLFPAYAELAGIDLGAVEQVPLEPPQLVPALAAGQVDAIGQFVVGQPLVAAAGDGREVVVLPYSEYLLDLYGVGLFTTSTATEQDPDLCTRFRDALLRGLEYALDNPAEAGAILAEYAPEANPEVAAAEVELMVPYAQVLEPGRELGWLDEAKVIRGIAVMEALGQTEPGLEPADLVAFALTPGGGQE